MIEWVVSRQRRETPSPLECQPLNYGLPVQVIDAKGVPRSERDAGPAFVRAETERRRGVRWHA